MDHLERELAAAVEAWDRRGWARPAAMVVSGSGLAVDLGTPVAGPVALAELLPFPIHPVAGHPHQVELLAPLPDRPVLYFRGRLHAYQGYTPAETVFPVRLGALLGARVLLLTNAAGGLHDRLAAGDLVLVRDHLNLSGANPLRGNPPAAWGPRFPDLSEAYDRRLRALLQERASALGIRLAEGVYAGVAGPSYETPAEVRMLAALGADVAGMSTVLEVIAARHMGVRCAALSLVANLGAGVAPHPLDHQEVLAAGQAAAEKLRRLLSAALAEPALLATT